VGSSKIVVGIMAYVENKHVHVGKGEVREKALGNEYNRQGDS
jgi:hypothetical protein